MSKVAVLGFEENGAKSYLAIQGNKQALGQTMGKALDALNEQLHQTSMVVIVQHLKADNFFSAQDQYRLSELMQEWHVAQESDKPWPEDKQNELQRSIDKELEAARLRAEFMSNDLK